MAKAKTRKTRIISVIIVAFLLTFGGLTVSAASKYDITAHTIAPSQTMLYYNGNGHSIAKNGYMILSANFDNSYSYAAGWKNVTTEVSHQMTSGTGTSCYFYANIGQTALYDAWIKNRSNVPMRVTGGYVEVSG